MTRRTTGGKEEDEKPNTRSHYGPEQPRIQTEVLGQSLGRSLALLTRSLALLTLSLVGKRMLQWLFILCFPPFWTIVDPTENGCVEAVGEVSADLVFESRQRLHFQQRYAIIGV